MSRQLSYHVVLRRDPDGQHYIEFGDYERAVARDELQELNYKRRFDFPNRLTRPSYHLVALPDGQMSTMQAELDRRNQQETTQS